jgi:hypothetical protein
LEKPERIFLRDAERTFVAEQDRQSFIKILQYLRKTFGDYHQGLGFTAGFLHLFFDEHQVVEICTILNTNDKYLKGEGRLGDELTIFGEI